MVEFQSRSVIATVLDSVAYCYVLLPCLPCYYSLHRSFRKGSFTHLGLACLCPSISTYRTRSTAHPGVSCLRPSIPTTRYASLPSPGSYFVAIPSCFLQLLAYCKFFSEVCPKLFICRPLVPPCLYLMTAPLVARITCAYFKYRS